MTIPPTLSRMAICERGWDDAGAVEYRRSGYGKDDCIACFEPDSLRRQVGRFVHSLHDVPARIVIIPQSALYRLRTHHLP
jgi:hypothetical protein